MNKNNPNPAVNEKNKPGDDVREAAESGEPAVAGRSHGQIVDAPKRPVGSSADESGRAGATPASSKK